EDGIRARNVTGVQTCALPISVKAGEFYYVPHGTIHAIGGGITILETQQSSDTTYRVYDYDRKDGHGNKRELHIEDSIAVSKIPRSEERRVGKSVNFDGGRRCV